MPSHGRPSLVRRRTEHGWLEFARMPVPEPLAGLVAGRCGNAEHSESAVERQLAASSLVPVVIGFGAPLEVLTATDGTGAGRSYGTFVAGLRPGHTVTRFRGSQACVQVYLTPLGVQRILGLPGVEVARRIVDLADVVPALSGSLADRLAAMTGWSERLQLVDRILVELASRGDEPDPEVRWMWERLERTCGKARIGALASRSGFSQRHLTDRFRTQVGLPPKTAARVLRFERAARAVSAGAPLTEAALDAGYADQSHLTREFARLAGATPATWGAEPRPSPSAALGE